MKRWTMIFFLVKQINNKHEQIEIPDLIDWMINTVGEIRHWKDWWHTLEKLFHQCSNNVTGHLIIQC